jgi:hypothetical protein
MNVSSSRTCGHPRRRAGRGSPSPASGPRRRCRSGPYRIVDFTLSNCINSGLRKIFIVTQYKAQSLNRHVRMGWNVVNRELGEFIEILFF